MPTFTVKAPAKLNLYLAVLGSRADGNHNLYTLFQRIHLFDEIRVTTLRRERKASLTVSGARIPSDRRNILYRAYECLRTLSPEMPPLKIRLRKKIPLAAGLGGGSSDAGTFLYAVNKKLKLRIKKEKLMKAAAGLGADVPFFATDISSAVGQGRGEQLCKLPPIKGLWFLIVSFPKGLSTKEIYHQYDLLKERSLALTKARHDVTILAKYLLQKDLRHVAPYLRNDLRRASISLKPAIQRVLNFLWERGVVSATMTGSGPTCFAMFTSRKLAKQHAKQVAKRFRLKTYVCKSF